MSSNPAPSTSVTTPNPHSSTSAPTAATFAGHSSSNSLPPTPPAAPSENQLNQEPDASVSPGPNHLQGVDPQIIEALRSKDRLFVLKLGETMESLIKDRSSRSRMDLSPSTSYQRLLIHRCSAYYRLTPETNPVTRGIAVVATTESRIPSRRICELVPAEAFSPPAIKIMRRSMQERKPKPQSNSGSIAGEEADFSDGEPEPSESGSQRGKGEVSGTANEKKRLTLKEREAAYSKARSRIFMDFEEKEKEKEKDMSASSSSLSLASGSTNGGSVGDIDDSTSSPTTESEWSAPSGRVTREKDSRGNISASSSSKSLRSSAQSYNPNGSGSSRNSRASSPSFTYATIYEPHQGPGYDQSQHFPPTGYQSAPYAYHYPPGQPPNPYMPQYPYYPPYNAYHSTPPYNPQSISDPTTPGGADMYPPVPHPAAYGHPYGWQHPPIQSAPPMQHPSHQISPQPPQATTHHTGPPLHGPPYPPYMPTTPVYTYPIPGYYTPPPGHTMEPPTPVMAPQGAFDVARTSNGSTNGSFVPANIPDHSTANGVVGPASNGRTPRHANSLGGSTGFSNGKGRGGAPGNQMRSPWSYGPGISGYGNASTGRGEAVGPRLSTTRRQSSNSNGTGTSRSSTSDDVSSTASSSTTSSSSRRTYTSTTSSQHPLPARPDWAVGLKPQPTLHPTLPRHHDHSLTNSRTMSPISPSRSLNGNNAHNHAPPQPPPISLQSTDFPPLTSVAGGPGKRAPVNTGAWANPSSTRSIRIPNTGQPNALVHHPTSNASGNGALPDPRFEEQDRDFERPPPKSAELYNPKFVRRSTGAKFQIEKEKEQGTSDTPCGAMLVGQVASMTLESREDDALVKASVVESLQ